MFEQLIPGVRPLDADDLNIGVHAKAASHTSSAPDAPDITADNPQVQEIVRLAQIYGGVILSGPPGTSKTFFAAAAARIMAGNDEHRVRFVQFHASYQYEDFMQGFTPTTSGFEPKDGPFLGLLREAIKDPENTFVLVIDELSRADVGRVFGEALTYIERSKREMPFAIANGEEIRVPSNLILLATMNPFDRGVDEVDAAFERRFAKISMDPDREILDEILTTNGMDDDLKRRLMVWFERINEHAHSNPAAAVGHAYFWNASDEATLDDIWEYQLKYLVQRAFRRDSNTRAALETGWDRVIAQPAPVELPATEEESIEPEV